MENQPITTIDRTALVAKVAGLKAEGYRLVHVCATTLADTFEVTYAFDKEYELINLRLNIARTDPVVPSITPHFLAAFTYENELQDLFGMTVTDLALNFNGHFYKLSMKAPFAVQKTDQGAK
jgi:ech hydrogenase subunit D